MIPEAISRVVRVLRDQRRLFAITFAIPAADVGGGLPFGEDGGLIAEFIGHGGVEHVEQVSALLDEAADFGGAAGGFAFVFVLLLAALVNGGEVGLEIGDEVGGQVVGDEFRGDSFPRAKPLLRNELVAWTNWVFCLNDVASAAMQF